MYWFFFWKNVYYFFVLSPPSVSRIYLLRWPEICIRMQQLVSPALSMYSFIFLAHIVHIAIILIRDFFEPCEGIIFKKCHPAISSFRTPFRIFMNQFSILNKITIVNFLFTYLLRCTYSIWFLQIYIGGTARFVTGGRGGVDSSYVE